MGQGDGAQLRRNDASDAARQFPRRAKSFAQSTRMNRIAAREGFLVLYTEQDWLANAQGCWNWFDTRSGRAYREADLIMRAIGPSRAGIADNHSSPQPPTSANGQCRAGCLSASSRP